MLPTAIALLLTLAPWSVTEPTASVRLRAESRDDRAFQQVKWGDKDITLEHRVRATGGLTNGETVFFLELQDQRITGSRPAAVLGVSPSPTPATTVERRQPLWAGPRITGYVESGFASGRLRAGLFPVEAAGGLLMGADEAREGYRPAGFAYRRGGWLFWAGTDQWDATTGNRFLGLLRYGAEPATFGGAVGYEAGALLRRKGSRPLHPGVDELSATPYLDLRLTPFSSVTLRVTGAGQVGERNSFQLTHAEETSRDNFLDGASTFFYNASTVSWDGDRGMRDVLAGLVRLAADWSPPVALSPTLGVVFQTSSGGVNDKSDQTFVPFRFDTRRFYGLGGYFGQQNARLYGARASIRPAEWDLAVAGWRMDVVSPTSGLIQENGERFFPAIYTAERATAAESHTALYEWDVALTTPEFGGGFRLRFGYAEVRPDAYIRDLERAGERFRRPYAQWAGASLAYAL